ACDLLEPLRPRLDAWAWRLFAERTLRFGHFRRDKRACLLDKTGRSRFYRAYEAACGPRRRALR
ncbi:MAG: CRISPR-associated endonuclease Cas1, partial [Gammaproteobacteria bacterium]|nr:CRISPR-associated endonuclease Cas1 [Gammaproteobacteria bacterium]